MYAVGDVTNRINLTPVAIREGHAFADTVFGKRPVQVDHATIPTAVFSQPEVGTVGLTETEARAQFQQALQIDPKHPLALRNLQEQVVGDEQFGHRRDRERGVVTV